MIVALLLAVLIQPGCPDEEAAVVSSVDMRVWTIIHDDGRNSRMLVSELTRNWAAPRHGLTHSESTLAMLRTLNVRRDALKRTVRLRHRRDAPPEFRWLPKYPALRFGDHEHAVAFDDRTFCESGYPLATVETLIANAGEDVSGWKRSCECVRLRAEREHVVRVTEWLTEIGESFESDREEEASAPVRFYFFDSMERQYSGRAGYPVFTAPVMPPSPMRRFPWEIRR